MPSKIVGIFLFVGIGFCVLDCCETIRIVHHPRVSSGFPDDNVGIGNELCINNKAKSHRAPTNRINY